MKVCLEKDPKLVQNLIGAGRELKSLDVQSWNCGTITRFIVSQERNVLKWLTVSKFTFLFQFSWYKALKGCCSLKQAFVSTP